MAWPATPLANPWVDGEFLNAAALFARITNVFNQLQAATYATDTGWVTTGWTLTATGITLSTGAIRKVGNRATVTFVGGTIGTTQSTAINGSGSTSGDYGNIPWITLPAGYLPAQAQPLVSGQNGPNFGWYVTTGGVITLASGPPTTATGISVSSATAWSVGGEYYLD